MIQLTARTLTSVAIAVCGTLTSASLIQFSNQSVEPEPFSDGWTSSVVSDRIHFFMPWALVGGELGWPASAAITVKFDADLFQTVDMIISGLSMDPQEGFQLFGGATMACEFEIYEIDENGDIIGSMLGSTSATLDASNALGWTAPISLSRNVRGLRSISTFVIETQDTPEFDWGHLALFNQQLHYTVVPEPGTMAALGVGALALLRRKRK